MQSVITTVNRLQVKIQSTQKTSGKIETAIGQLKVVVSQTDNGTQWGIKFGNVYTLPTESPSDTVTTVIQLIRNWQDCEQMMKDTRTQNVVDGESLFNEFVAGYSRLIDDMASSDDVLTYLSTAGSMFGYGIFKDTEEKIQERKERQNRIDVARNALAKLREFEVRRDMVISGYRQGKREYQEKYSLTYGEKPCRQSSIKAGIRMGVEVGETLLLADNEIYTILDSVCANGASIQKSICDFWKNHKKNS